MAGWIQKEQGRDICNERDVQSESHGKEKRTISHERIETSHSAEKQVSDCDI